jgi:hypothetical protein
MAEPDRDKQEKKSKWTVSTETQGSDPEEETVAAASLRR